MGIFRRRREVGRRFRMRERLISLGDDYWIEDADGNRAYRVNGKVARIRDTWVLEGPGGETLATIRERKLSVRDAIRIELDGQNATVKKALIGIRDRFHVDLDDAHDLKVHGNVLDHEYEIDQDGETLGRISKKWFRLRDTYGVEVLGAADPVLILSVTVAVDALAHD